MAKFIGELVGIHGRRMKLYDTKCVIIFDKTAGSFQSGNIADGEKTIFLKDVVAVQYKKSSTTAGYLQFETPSIQEKNADGNMFSENTFVYEDGKNKITNELMEEIYHYIVDHVEELKYRRPVALRMPVFPDVIDNRSAEIANLSVAEQLTCPEVTLEKTWQHIDRTAAIQVGDTNIRCANCDYLQFRGNRICKKCGAKFIKRI